MEKKLLDDLIRITRKYASTGDVDYLAAKFEAARKLSDDTFSTCDKWSHLMDFVTGILGKGGLNELASYEAIYNAFNALGIKVLDTTKGDEV